MKKIVGAQLIALMTVSLHVNAAVVGDIVGSESSCTQNGLGFISLGNGFVSGGVFVPAPSPSGTPHFECTEGGGIAKQSAQITKRTNLAIKNHLYNDMLYHFANDDGIGIVQNTNEARLAASSDSNKYMPDDLWGVASSTEISNDQGPQSDTDIYQFVGGFDKVVGDFIFGAALTYAHTEDEQRKVHSTADTVGITPYAAYKITNYLFASTLLGYNYTHTNAVGGRSDLDSNDFISETNLNLFKVIDGFILKGRAGFRYKHTHTMLEKDFNGRDDDFDELTWIGDVEVGYQFENKVQIYTGFLYEYYDREASASSTLVHDGIGFMRYGAEYPINNALVLGAKIEHDINDEDDDYITGSINARLNF